MSETVRFEVLNFAIFILQLAVKTVINPVFQISDLSLRSFQLILSLKQSTTQFVNHLIVLFVLAFFDLIFLLQLLHQVHLYCHLLNDALQFIIL